MLVYVFASICLIIQVFIRTDYMRERVHMGESELEYIYLLLEPIDCTVKSFKGGSQ